MNPPVFGHGELRLVILTLIAREPRHGYELIHALNEHFEGDYSPSAGTIYPRLAKLEEEGLVTKTQDGRKSVYTITDAGRAEVEARREEFKQITTERTDSVRSLAQSARIGLARARRGLRAELDEIAAEARKAAEAALHREREAAAEDAPKPAADQPGTAAPTDAGASEPAPSNPNAETADTDTQDDPEALAAEASEAEATVRGHLLRRVDVALQEFRMELRHDSREAAQLGSLTEDSVAEIETQLRETRRRLGVLLHIHR